MAHEHMYHTSEEPDTELYASESHALLPCYASTSVRTSNMPYVRRCTKFAAWLGITVVLAAVAATAAATPSARPYRTTQHRCEAFLLKIQLHHEGVFCIFCCNFCLHFLIGMEATA